MGEAPLGLDRFHDGVGSFRQRPLLIQSEMESQLLGVHQRIEAATVGHAVSHLAQRRHLNGGPVGIDVAGQALAGDGFHHAVAHSGVDLHQASRRFQHELLAPFLFWHNAGFQNRRGGTDGVGAGVDRVAHHFHDDIAGRRPGIGWGHQQVHRHLWNTVRFFQQQPTQAIGVVPQVLHLRPHGISRQWVNAAGHNPADIATGVGIH